MLEFRYQKEPYSFRMKIDAAMLFTFIQAIDLIIKLLIFVT